VAHEVRERLAELRLNTREFLEGGRGEKREAVLRTATEIQTMATALQRLFVNDPDRQLLLAQIAEGSGRFIQGFSRAVAVQQRRDERVATMLRYGRDMQDVLSTIVARSFEFGDFEGSLRASRLQRRALESQQSSLQILLTGELDRVPEIVTDLQRLLLDMRRLELLLVNLADRDQMVEVRRSVALYAETFSEIATPVAERKKLIESVLDYEGDAIEGLTAYVQAVTATAMQEVDFSFDRLLGGASRWNLALALVGVLSGLIIAWVIARVTIRPINVLSQATVTLAGGAHRMSLPYLERRDEVGDLARALQIFQRALVGIREAMEAADTANRVKSDFLAMMSHEIRTPMNGVLGMLEILQQTNLSAEQQELALVVSESASSLLKIIDDILDFSKIEAGKLEIEKVAVSPLHVVEGVAETLAPLARKKEIALTTFVDPAVPAQIVSDPVRLRQILFNLVGNGLKFTERGQVLVHAELVGATPGGVTLYFRVTDTGIGLTPEAQERLFRPFVQAEESTARRFGGTGLGLSICKRLVELMGGEIGVNSKPGEGSTFWFSLPTQAVKGAPAEMRASLADLRVLVVEDDTASRRTLTEYLIDAGARVIAARDGADTLRQLRNGQAKADVAIIDLRLPDMHGFALWRAIATEATGQDLKAILLTAYDETGQRRRAQEAGFVGYLTKPVRRMTMTRAVAVAAGRAAADTEGQAIAATARTAPSRDEALRQGALILVVEDNRTNQMVIRRQLERLGYACDVASDGRAGLAAYEANDYGFVLTDVNMPLMDGFVLTAAIRERQRGGKRRHCPIVALTANALRGEAERCLKAGMDDYLSKPVSLVDLQACLGRWLPLADDAQAGWLTVGAGPPVADDDPAPIDLEALKGLLGEIDELARTLLASFVGSNQEVFETLTAAVDARDAEAVASAAHSLKGAARNACAAELAAIAEAIETAAKAGDWSAVDAALPAVGPALARIEGFVDRLTVPAASEGAWTGIERSGIPSRGG
jgi:signal transduction histidine kinase/CheY-like chemotaxis protein/HPt (histidine-containing phosphotransfer) domain-containing protein